jgi:hypothetical protein
VPRLNHDELPIVPHSDLGDEDCCGCLIVKERGDEADLICNECGALIRTVPTDEVPERSLRCLLNVCGNQRAAYVVLWGLRRCLLQSLAAFPQNDFRFVEEAFCERF